MGNLSPNFSRAEFSCKCGCGFDTVDAQLLDLLENIRNFFDKPVHITSACRCVHHNEAVGGSHNSQHLKARAADIVVSDIEPDIVAEFAETLMQGRGGIGRYSTFTHVDTRRKEARWNG